MWISRVEKVPLLWFGEPFYEIQVFSSEYTYLFPKTNKQNRFKKIVVNLYMMLEL